MWNNEERYLAKRILNQLSSSQQTQSQETPQTAYQMVALRVAEKWTTYMETLKIALHTTPDRKAGSFKWLIRGDKPGEKVFNVSECQSKFTSFQVLYWQVLLSNQERDRSDSVILYITLLRIFSRDVRWIKLNNKSNWVNKT